LPTAAKFGCNRAGATANWRNIHRKHGRFPMSKDAPQAKRNQRAKAAKANAKAKQKLSAEELAKVSGGQDLRSGGGAWRVRPPYR